MILSDHDIKSAISAGTFIIDPLPQEEDYDTTAVNLHLGDEYLEWDFESAKKSFGVVVVDLSNFNYRMLAKGYTKEVPKDADGSIILKPQQFIISSTKETVGNPDASCCLAARVEGRSSLARLGLQIHMTAPTIHAGFHGKITLEILKIGPLPLRLSPGLAICQLIIEQVSSTPEGARCSSQFQGQQSATGAT